MRKFLLYPRLAAVNLRKNRQTYLPYLLTCVGAVMMLFIMLTLASDPALREMSGGSVLGGTLTMGCAVIAIFSVILVFYANSFIIKQRKKEFGLYNILGMEKRHIGRMLTWETFYTALISFVCGIGFGILLAKLLQLGLMRLLKFDVQFGIYLNPFSISVTLIMFTVLFLLMLLNDLRIIHLSKPVELLHGTQEGEREPKSKWILAVLGVLCIIIGYALSIMTKSASDALVFFFVAVIFVIFGTYLTFTAFSIVFLKRLRANKKYYYKTAHFATVSGMLYRMKKNAGGLASICILSTMALVTVSVTVSLYVGMDDMLDAMYSREVTMTLYSEDDASNRYYAQLAEDTAAQSGREITESESYYSLTFPTLNQGGGDFIYRKNVAGTDSVTCLMTFIDLESYNAITGQDVSLAPGEALMYTDNFTNNAYTGDRVTILGLPYSVTHIENVGIKTSEIYLGWENYVLVMNFDELLTVEETELQIGADFANTVNYKQSFNIDGTDEEKLWCVDAIDEALRADEELMKKGGYSLQSRVEDQQEFLVMYGGLLFLGLFLGLLFTLATVLIIYYKQVTEGYDDREKFRIMQNVGMTEGEVKKTIHAQVLIVFFLPLVTTFIHIAFAFPMIRRILSLFNLTNIGLFIGCTVIAAAIFALMYTVIYLITAKTYYKIVR